MLKNDGKVRLKLYFTHFTKDFHLAIFRDNFGSAKIGWYNCVYSKSIIVYHLLIDHDNSKIDGNVWFFVVVCEFHHENTASKCHSKINFC